MQDVKVGHFSNSNHGTGVSVFLFEQSAVGSYWICGSAPASHELAALNTENMVQLCHGLVFTGGSALGLHTALGVKRYLTEHGIGHPVPTGVMPIVPANAIYDLAYKDAVFPTAEDAYAACLAASEGDESRGRVGAGTGATVGKLVPGANCMSGGIGRCVIKRPDGLEVMAYVVVNAAGDVHDRGNIIAGASYEGEFVHTTGQILVGRAEEQIFSDSNTTLAAVFTNADLDKAQCVRIAKMATAGMGASIAPVFTSYDGDIAFCFSLGEHHATEITIGTMASEAVRLAILDAVKETEVIQQ